VNQNGLLGSREERPAYKWGSRSEVVQAADVAEVAGVQHDVDSAESEAHASQERVEYLRLGGI
jgi:hypothetical protein